MQKLYEITWREVPGTAIDVAGGFLSARDAKPPRGKLVERRGLRA